jgi:iron complex transport system substrate-binding protein
MDTIPTDERANVAYLLGDSGLNAIAKDSYQGQVIDLCANNVVEVDNASGAGSGNEIDLEQLALWDPDIILFGPDSIYDSVYEEAAWKELTAVKTKEIYLVPSTPYNWLNYPPTVNQVMGMQWLPRLLYPEKFDTSIEDVTRAYYKLFYSYDLSDTELIELLQGAV